MVLIVGFHMAAITLSQLRLWKAVVFEINRLPLVGPVALAALFGRKFVVVVFRLLVTAIAFL